MIYQTTQSQPKTLLDTYSDLALNPFDAEFGIVHGDSAVSQAVTTLSKLQHRDFYNEPDLGVSLDNLRFLPMSDIMADTVLIQALNALNAQEPRVDLALTLSSSLADKQNRVYRVQLADSKRNNSYSLEFL